MGKRSKVNSYTTIANSKFLISDTFGIYNRLCTYKVSLKSVNGQSLWDFNIGGNPPYKFNY
jgi:hypothetical protein